MVEASFGDLRRLADWIASSTTIAWPPWLPRLLDRLGATAVPALGRALRSADPRRLDAARRALASVATDHRARVIAELHAIATGLATAAQLDGAAQIDDAKACAVGLLAELGERGEARFADPHAIRRRSALALAGELDTAAQVASVVDLMLQRLGDDEIADMVDAMAEVASPAAARVAAEIACRLDASVELQTRVAPAAGGTVAAPRRDRAARASVLVDAAARLVVIACRRHGKRSRRWAVLIGASGAIDSCECVESDGPEADAAALIDDLAARGYRVATTDADHARAIVAAAARLTASERPDALGSGYYVGRDLLDLGDAHLAGRPRVAVVAATLGRAVELIAADQPERALALLARCDAADPTIAATIAACLVAQGRHGDALAHLTCACEADRAWPLHHWNLAAALHATGDADGCEAALRAFLVASEVASALDADPDQPGRVALAHRLVAERERTARLSGVKGKRRRRARHRVKSR